MCVLVTVVGSAKLAELTEMSHAFKKHDGKVVVASFMELKAKDISCSGWKVRRDRTV